MYKGKAELYKNDPKNINPLLRTKKTKKVLDKKARKS